MGSEQVLHRSGTGKGGSDYLVTGNGNPTASLLMLVGLSYFTAVAAAIFISKQTSTLAWPLWPASAIVVVALLRTPSRSWPALLITALAADWAAGLMMGRQPLLLLGVSTANVLEPLLVGAALRRFAPAASWYLSVRWMLLFALFSFLGSAGAMALAIGWETIVAGGNFLEIWQLATITDALSLMILTPFLLCWTEPKLRRKLGRAGILENLGLSVAVGAVSILAFSGSMPTLFLVFPVLVVITLRAELMGATAGVACLTAVSIFYTANGWGPIATLNGAGPVAQVLILQFYLASAVVTTLSIAVILALRSALAARLRRQDEISSASLANMVQGLCMFDDQERLITCNARYCEIYGLSPEMMLPGVSLQRVLELKVASGSNWGDPENFDISVLSEDLRGTDRELELRDGRIIHVHRQPTSSGGWVATHEDVTERRRAGHRIAYLASHDPLTGVANRACFREQLQRALSLSHRGYSIALHSLDLDRFKAVNDMLGHAAGDELLIQVANAIRGELRDGDLLARLGGDEFAIIQFFVDKPEQAEALAQRIVGKLGDPFDIGGHEVQIGVSIGTALAPSDADEMVALLQKSDLALYRAKSNGRNGHCFFEAGMDTLMQERRAMEAELRHAIRKGQLELHYQPVLNLETGAISSFEALLRWNHPIRGVVAPENFIPLAEETGLIVPIGEWVLRQACREAAAWPGHIKVAINLSAVQFKKRSLTALVQNALKASRLDGKRLELEITESVLLQDGDTVIAMLHELRDLGVSIAMDDFGTGYSSLSYLRSFPFDRIKIDRSFVRDVSSKADSLAIIHATTEISGKLGMRTTAEGVETAEQLSILRSEGCTEIQGYLVSRPLPAQQVNELLNRYAYSKHGAWWPSSLDPDAQHSTTFTARPPRLVSL